MSSESVFQQNWGSNLITNRQHFKRKLTTGIQGIQGFYSKWNATPDLKSTATKTSFDLLFDLDLQSTGILHDIFLNETGTVLHSRHLLGLFCSAKAKAPRSHGPNKLSFTFFGAFGGCSEENQLMASNQPFKHQSLHREKDLDLVPKDCLMKLVKDGTFSTTPQWTWTIPIPD